MSFDTLSSVPAHPTGELLEEYSFGRVSEPALMLLEEHLLDCTLCQSKLLEIDEYAALMKSGISAFQRKRQASLAGKLIPASGWAFRLNLALALSLILVIVSGGALARHWWSPPAGDSIASTVKLVALRGSGIDANSRGPSGRPLDLVIDTPDLPSSLSYLLEIVNYSGSRIWTGAGIVVDQRISARMAKPLSAGSYWVRLYSTQEGVRENQLLREFGLRIE